MHWFIVFLLAVSSAQAETARVAVAANFVSAAQDLARLVPEHEIQIIQGSTGKLYAQIRAGAPFDLFLAADMDRPERLAEAGLSQGPAFAYAGGILVLWTRADVTAAGAREVLEQPVRRLAMADPALAPYGVAARRTLERWGLHAEFEDRLVLGESVGQTFGFAATGNADLAFVALSQVLGRGGTAWTVSKDVSGPILQGAVILPRATGNPAAEAFLSALRSEAGQRLLAERGYEAVE